MLDSKKHDIDREDELVLFAYYFFFNLCEK